MAVKKLTSRPTLDEEVTEPQPEPSQGTGRRARRSTERPELDAAEPQGGFLRTAEAAAAEVVGGMTDMIPGLSFFAEKAGLGVPPQGAELGPVARGGARAVGNAATLGAGALAAPLRAAAGGVQQLIGRTNVARQGVQSGIRATGTRFLDDTVTFAQTRPGSFFSIELGAAGAAGTAGAAVEEAGGSPTEAMLAELAAGGTTAVAIPFARAASQVAPTAQFVKGLVGISPSRAQRRAAARVQRGAADAASIPERAARGRQEVLEDAPLTLGELAQDQGLLQLQRSVARATAELTSAEQARFAAVNRVSRETLQNVPGTQDGPPPTAEEARLFLDSLVQERIRIARAKVDESLEKLGPSATREDTNALARVELDRAFTAAKEQERALYDAVPVTDAPIQSTLRAYKSLLNELAEDRVAQQRAGRDIPPVLSALLGRTDPKTGKFVPGKLTKDGGTTTRELTTLRSSLQQVAAAERAKDAPNRRLIRAAEKVADGVLDDLSAAPAVPATVGAGTGPRGQVLAAIRAATGNKVGAEANIAALRRELAALDADDVSRELRALQQEGRIELLPIDDPQRRTRLDDLAAVRLPGGQPRNVAMLTRPLDDPAQQAGAGNEALDIARGFSRDLNQRFRQGEVGRLLGFEQTGELAVPAGLTLEATLGAAGLRGANAADELLRSVERSGDPEAMAGHIQNFLRDEFRRAAVEAGTVNPKKAQTYLRRRQDLLARFPELQRQMQQAAQAGEEAVVAQSISDPTQSAAALILKAPPGREASRIASSPNARAKAIQARELLDQDPTERALAGMQKAIAEEIFRRARTPTADVTDEPFLSARRIGDLLQDPGVRAVVEELGDIGMLDRIRRVQATVSRLEQSRRAPEAAEGIIGDQESLILGLARRFGAAALGREVQARSGARASIQGVSAFTRAADALASRGADPAEIILIDAVTAPDDVLLRTLLDEKGIPNTPQARKRLNAWAFATAADYGLDIGPTGEEDQ